MLNINQMLTCSFLCLYSLSGLAKVNVIPLEQTESGHLSFPVKINQKSATFILDTGASGTVIDDAKLAHFNIKPAKDKQQGYVPGGEGSAQIETQKVSVQSLTLNGVDTDMKYIHAHNLRSQFGDKYDGLAGQDMLLKTGALLDVANKTLILPDSQQEQKAYISNLLKSGYAQYPIQTHPMGLHYIQLSLKGESIYLIVDSGASDTVLDQKSVQALNLVTKPHPKATSIDKNGQAIPMHYMPAQTLKIDDISITKDLMVFDMSGMLHMLNQQQPHALSGVLGLMDLGSIKAVIDISNSTLYLSSGV